MNKIVIAALLSGLAAAPSAVFAEVNPKFPPLDKPAAPAPKPVVADMSLPMPQGLKGDVAKGHDFYMQNCSTCHGVTGAGDGPRAYSLMPATGAQVELGRRIYNDTHITVPLGANVWFNDDYTSPGVFASDFTGISPD